MIKLHQSHNAVNAYTNHHDVYALDRSISTLSTVCPTTLLFCTVLFTTSSQEVMMTFSQLVLHVSFACCALSLSFHICLPCVVGHAAVLLSCRD